MTSFETNRWHGIEGLTLLAVALGVLVEQPALVLVGALGVGYAAFARLGDAPEPSITIARELDDDAPEPGDEVTVSVTVTNDGAAPLFDLRFVDGVPPALEVVDGTARLGTALRPGESATVSYTVVAVRGTHRWDPASAITRAPSGARERAPDVEAETDLRCLPSLDAGADLPLRGLTTPYTGRVATDVGGAGIEFHSTREYRRGDPVRRIDWKKRARTGELATLNLREERAATVVLVVDSREEAYRAPDESGRNAVERSVDAAMRLFTALEGGGDRVGIAAVSGVDCWLAPTVGNEHRVRAREVFATHPALAATHAGEPLYPTIWLRRLRRRLPNDAQILFFSPLCDDYAARLARRLDAHGHLVTVVSPDPTAVDTPGHRLARVERTNRLRGLRRAGLRVVDWGDDPLSTTVAATKRRWSR
ncbi:DUF58 domain-containing protein [Haloferacaceae archaeon DSL9]